MPSVYAGFMWPPRAKLSPPRRGVGRQVAIFVFPGRGAERCRDCQEGRGRRAMRTRRRVGATGGEAQEPPAQARGVPAWPAEPREGTADPVDRGTAGRQLVRAAGRQLVRARKGPTTARSVRKGSTEARSPAMPTCRRAAAMVERGIADSDAAAHRRRVSRREPVVQGSEDTPSLAFGAAERARDLFGRQQPASRRCRQMNAPPAGARANSRKLKAARILGGAACRSNTGRERTHLDDRWPRAAWYSVPRNREETSGAERRRRDQTGSP